MKYRYNIKHKVQGQAETINFKNKRSLIKYLNNNTNKVNKLDAVVINFGQIMLPLKQTVWNQDMPS